MTLNAMELALGVISDKTRRSKKLEKRLREIDRLAARALAAPAKERAAMLRQISSTAGSALVEERSFGSVESSVKRKVRTLARNN